MGRSSYHGDSELGILLCSRLDHVYIYMLSAL